MHLNSSLRRMKCSGLGQTLCLSLTLCIFLYPILVICMPLESLQSQTVKGKSIINEAEDLLVEGHIKLEDRSVRDSSDKGSHRTASVKKVSEDKLQQKTGIQKDDHLSWTHEILRSLIKPHRNHSKGEKKNNFL